MCTSKRESSPGILHKYDAFCTPPTIREKVQAVTFRIWKDGFLLTTRPDTIWIFCRRSHIWRITAILKNWYAKAKGKPKATLTFHFDLAICKSQRVPVWDTSHVIILILRFPNASTIYSIYNCNRITTTTHWCVAKTLNSSFSPRLSIFHITPVGLSVLSKTKINNVCLHKLYDMLQHFWDLLLANVVA